MNTEISDADKTKLTGRIYPTILNCVNNRYKIIAGYFAIVGFLLVIEKLLKQFIDSGTLVYLPIIFTILVFLNSFNYWLNTKEQCELENRNKNISVLKESWLDIAFSLVMAILIWGGYFFLKTTPYTA
jgi:F0F1-type ATP synthase membrane subunit a